MMKGVVPLLLAALVGLVVATSEVGTAQLKVVNALPPPMLDFSSTFLDVLVDGATLFSKVEYLFGSSYVSVPIGSHVVSFRYSNYPQRGIITSIPVQITTNNTHHTVVAYGRNTTDFPFAAAHLLDQPPIPRAVEPPAKQQQQQQKRTFMPIVHEDDASDSLQEAESDAKGSSSTYVRYFNAGMALGPTTVTLQGADVFVATPYGQAANSGKYMTQASGTVTYALVDARYQEIVITFDQLQLNANCAYTLFSAGVLGNSYSPLMVVDTPDWCN